MRIGIALSQFGFFQLFFFMYMINARFAHRFVGYLEEEAVHTYTLCLQNIDNEKLLSWKHMKAPAEAVEYYGLNPETATMRDVVLSVRADEAVHRSVNHHFSDIPEFYDIHNDKVQISTDGFRDLTDEQLKDIESQKLNHDLK